MPVELLCDSAWGRVGHSQTLDGGGKEFVRNQGGLPIGNLCCVSRPPSSSQILFPLQPLEYVWDLK